MPNDTDNPSPVPLPTDLVVKNGSKILFADGPDGQDSGNHGLTAILPIWAIREFITCEEKDVLEAMALSHLVDRKSVV